MYRLELRPGFFQDETLNFMSLGNYPSLRIAQAVCGKHFAAGDRVRIVENSTGKTVFERRGACVTVRLIRAKSRLRKIA